MEQSKARTKRRPWYRPSIRLRGLMILIAVVGGLMGWRARRASLQRTAVAGVERLQGGVVYDWQYGGHPYLTKPGAVPPGPAWLRKFLGDEYFQEVAQVNLPARLEFSPEMGAGEDALARWSAANEEFRRRLYVPLEGDQLACLDRFDRLEALLIQGPFRLGPAALDRLGRMGRLRSLMLGNNLDQAGLDRLAELRGLEMLSLQLLDGGRTDLAFLARMPGLRTINVVGVGLDDDHLAQIGRARGLESLTLTGPLLTDRGLAHLGGLKSLKYLAIFSCPGVTAGGLSHLEGLEELQSIIMSGMPTDRAGLDQLRKLPKLKSAAVAKGRLGDEEIGEFRAARPGVSLTFLP